MIPLYYSARSLWARRLSTGLTVLGLGLVVFVFAAVLMLARGIESALAAGGSPLTVVLLREGSSSELTSVVEQSAVRALAGAPEVATSVQGEPVVEGELVVVVLLPRGAEQMNVSARGVGPRSFEARPTVQLVAGRAPRPGTHEVVLGQSLVGRGPGAELGGALEFAGQRWPVVGILSAQGGAYESEVWADFHALASAMDRPQPTSVIARVRSPQAREAFLRRVEQDPRFILDAKPESEYWEGQAAGWATFIRVLGLFVSLVFGVGAVLGAMVTMYAQVASRVAELGMLRAVGFRRRSVLGSVLVESAMLGAAGGVVGALGALATRWLRVSTLNFQTFAEVSFGFKPTPGILLGALAFGVGMGAVGGLLPALRAARLSILEALRA